MKTWTQDPEDSVVAHSLFDPHIEPQDADGELEDPSMLPSSGVGYELEKRDQLREGRSANMDVHTFTRSRCAPVFEYELVEACTRP